MPEQPIHNTFEQQRARILETLDVERIQKTMDALNWKWQNEVPTPRCFYTTADMLLHQARGMMDDESNHYAVTATGGLEVVALRRTDGAVSYTLSFNATRHTGWSYA